MYLRNLQHLFILVDCLLIVKEHCRDQWKLQLKTNRQLFGNQTISHSHPFAFDKYFDTRYDIVDNLFRCVVV